MRRSLIVFAVVVLLLLPVVALGQGPGTSTTPAEPVWPGFLPPVAGRMYDDLGHQRWVIDPATGDLAYRAIDPFLDVEVRGTRQLYTELVRGDDGTSTHVVGVRWMDFRGLWHAEPWVSFGPLPPLTWIGR